MLRSSGSYTGNGVDERAVTGVGFQPRCVFIKRSTADGLDGCYFKLDTMPGTVSKNFSNVGTIQASAGIQSLDADGFTVGTRTEVNSDGIVYYWIAFTDDGNDDFETGSYVGDASDDRDISVGFQPDVVLVGNLTTAFIVPYRTSDHASNVCNQSFAGSLVNDHIQEFQSTSFQIGTSGVVNASGSSYVWVAFRSVPGVFATFTYTGNATDNRSISGVGFQPIFSLVKSSTTAQGVMRFEDHVGDLSNRVSEAQAPNYIQAFEADGIQIGTEAEVNADTIVFRGFAIAPQPVEVGLEGSLPAMQGELVKGLSHEVVGALPAMSGMLALSVSKALTGDLPAMSGTPIFVQSLQRAVSGTLPPMSGNLIGQAALLRSVAGTLPPMTGDLAFLKLVARLLGDLPPMSGIVTSEFALAQAISGSLPPQSGTLALNATIAILGMLPPQTGLLSLDTALSLQGLLPAQSGALALSIAIAINGTLPPMQGTLALSVSKALLGNLPAQTGLLGLTAQLSLEGLLPPMSGALNIAAVRELIGDLPSMQGTLGLSILLGIRGDLPPMSGFIPSILEVLLAGSLPPMSGAIIQLRLYPLIPHASAQIAAIPTVGHTKAVR